MLRYSLNVATFFEGGTAILGVLEKVVEERRGKNFKVRVSQALIPCREIKIPKKKID